MSFREHAQMPLHLVVEPDVHEEAVHVGPEKSRTNQMRQTLEGGKQAQLQEFIHFWGVWTLLMHRFNALISK